MGIFMITAGEVQFIKDLIYDLSALADPSDYVEKEINEAYIILDKLASYDTQMLITIYSQLQEIQNNDDTE